MTSEDKHEKVLFIVQVGDSTDHEIESIWTKPTERGYLIDNIPFYATGVAYGDTVSIIENDGQKYANEIIEVSGHSTLRIWFNDETYVSVTRNELQQLGCSSEISDQPKLVAVDVPPDVDYQKVQAYLDIGFKSGRWDYEEACLGF